jgi:hypothetical protein
MIDRVPNVLLVLSSGALDDRIADPDDWVRKEVAYAFARKKHIMPVFLEGFDWKTSAPLPPGLEDLRTQHGHCHHHQNWDATMNWIVSNLKR